MVKYNKQDYPSWLKGSVLKTDRREIVPGFESLILRASGSLPDNR